MVDTQHRKARDAQDFLDGWNKEQNEKRKKLQWAYEDALDLYEVVKAERKKKVENAVKKKTEDFKEQNQKNEEIMQRIKLAEDMRDQFKREQEHEFMLQNEQRRLKEEDIRNLRERQKRLQMKRKQEIMNKDTQSTEYLKLIKESEDYIQ
jgi:hypothetical protein